MTQPFQYIDAPDGARLYVQSTGVGRPLFLLHGWTMSSVFWQRQVEALAKDFRVITMDLRGHGNSSKILQGHTIPQYARDVRTVLEALDIHDAVLVAWSLAGPVVLEYWKHHGPDRLRALALVETTPYPMSGAAWNTHPMRSHDFIAMHKNMRALQEDRAMYAQRFVKNMFAAQKPPVSEVAWMVAEHYKISACAAVAIYSDYVTRDYTSVLGTITLPTLVAKGNAPHTCFGPRTGEFLAGQIPNSRLMLFQESCHMPFYEEATLFNQAIAELARV